MPDQEQQIYNLRSEIMVTQKSLDFTGRKQGQLRQDRYIEKDTYKANRQGDRCSQRKIWTNP